MTDPKATNKNQTTAKVKTILSRAEIRKIVLQILCHEKDKTSQELRALVQQKVGDRFEVQQLLVSKVISQIKGNGYLTALSEPSYTPAKYNITPEGKEYLQRLVEGVSRRRFDGNGDPKTEHFSKVPPTVRKPMKYQPIQDSERVANLKNALFEVEIEEASSMLADKILASVEYKLRQGIAKMFSEYAESIGLPQMPAATATIQKERVSVSCNMEALKAITELQNSAVSGHIKTQGKKHNPEMIPTTKAEVPHIGIVGISPSQASIISTEYKGRATFNMQYSDRKAIHDLADKMQGCFRVLFMKDFGKHSNFHALRKEDGFVLVDGGTTAIRAKVEEAIAEFETL